MNLAFLIQTFWLAFKAIPMTLLITSISLLIGLPFGLLLAWIKIRKIRILYPLAAIYTSLMRATPMVLFILLFYSTLPSLLNVIFNQKLHLGLKIFEINPVVYAIIVFTLIAVANLSEVFRSAILTIDPGQKEAGLMVGLTVIQIYYRIIIPQALVSAIPNIGNLTLNILKGTSLAFMMTVQEVTAVAKTAASHTYNYTEAYIDIFIIYFILGALLQIIFKYLEKHLSRHKVSSTIA
ncbi:amino acid ABC transporter permease [Leuconostoc carnosum]|uniref:amino acid ABC transporter permease n=1 Tax=Leuconostoc carnosum TaxID=1252 RepID=UPI001239750F|nr:amino acid ABC transporter permease [Leuconostoc carnosum]KAA8371445.1 amino acid ABC transporter permease [Leuconostoc carnosum]KAA8383166.1 amino acid ABC transporter permease [Leuconostoc carnosum]